MLSFEWLIDPISPETFFAEYYERKPLLIQGKDPAKFARCSASRPSTGILPAPLPAHPDVFLVDAARELEARGLLVSRRRRTARPAARLSAVQVRLHHIAQPAARAHPGARRALPLRGADLQRAISRPTSISPRATPRGSRRTTTATTCSPCRSPDRSTGPSTRVTRRPGSSSPCRGRDSTPRSTSPAPRRQS